MGTVLDNKNDSFENNSIIIDETEIAYIFYQKQKEKKGKSKFQVGHYHNE